jgi:hypothetical protein
VLPTDSTPPNGRRLLHPSYVRRNEMSAIMPPIFFSKEVTQKQATPPKGPPPPPPRPRYTAFPASLTPYSASPDSTVTRYVTRNARNAERQRRYRERQRKAKD